MSLRGKASKSSIWLMLGEGANYGSSFLRNMILARLLTKGDFGISATFVLIVTLLEFSAKLGVARFVVRDKHGNEPDFIATAHLVQFIGAILSSLLILSLAKPLVWLFGLPEQASAVVALALLPLFRGFEHLDVRRFERELRFVPSTLVDVIPQVIITLAAWPVASWIPDYRAVLILLLAKTFFGSVASHFLAERAYSWRMNMVYIRDMLQFGWPLVVNGLLLFVVLQGDQLCVASFYTMADMGMYSAAAALTMAPTFLFGRVFNSIMLPLLAKAQDEPSLFQKRYRQALSVEGVFSATLSVGCIVGSEVLMQMTYGQKYAGSGIIMSFLAASNAFRNIRMAPALAALAKGDSVNQMISNIWRSIAIVPTLAFASLHYPVWMLACTGLIGEIFACTIPLFRLRRRDGIPLHISLIPLAWISLLLCLSAIPYLLGIQYTGKVTVIFVAVLLALLAGLVMISISSELRSEMGHAWMFLRRYGPAGLVEWVKSGV